MRMQRCTLASIELPPDAMTGGRHSLPSEQQVARPSVPVGLRVFGPSLRQVLFGTLALFVLGWWGCQTPRPRPRAFFERPAAAIERVYKTKPQTLRMLVYPSDVPLHVGTVVFVHGGGWMVGGTDLPLYEDWAAPLAAAGLRAVSVEHRLIPRYTAPDLVADLRDSLVYLQEHASELRIPRDNFALVGFSSGGHLAALLALENARVPNDHGGEAGGSPGPRLPIRAVVAFYSPLDAPTLFKMSDARMRQLLAGLTGFSPVQRVGMPEVTEQQRAAALERVSPLHQLSAGAPPFLLVHGASDRLVPVDQSRRFAQAARKVGLHAELREYPKLGHNFDVLRRHRSRGVPELCVKFIVRHLQARSGSAAR